MGMTAFDMTQDPVSYTDSAVADEGCYLMDSNLPGCTEDSGLMDMATCIALCETSALLPFIREGPLPS